MRNPKWHRDEIILALELYFSPDRGSIDASNPKILELSKLLNSLPLIQDRPDKEKFRNANGVSLKMSNFLSLDKENYSGKGMSRRSKLDEEVFKEFYRQRKLLNDIASKIKQIGTYEEVMKKVAAIEEDEQTIRDVVKEGATLYKLHKVKERDIRIVKRKKEKVLALKGKLICEVCDFDFFEFYGAIGYGFIECHHKTPLASLEIPTDTSLEDLALVCSNCHRILHRKINELTVEVLRRLIKNS